MTRFVVIYKNHKKLNKAVNLEALVFYQDKTNFFDISMIRRAYIFAKLKNSKISETVATSKANYDY